MTHQLYRGCPLFGGSVVRGFTVFVMLNAIDIITISCLPEFDTQYDVPKLNCLHASSV